MQDSGNRVLHEDLLLQVLYFKNDSCPAKVDRACVGTSAM